MRFTNLGAWSSWGPGLLVSLVLMTAESLAWGQQTSPDPVEVLAQVLKSPVRNLQRREVALAAQIDRLTRVDELRRALLLPDWRDQDPDEAIAAVDHRYRGMVMTHFEEAVHQALHSEIATRVETLKMLMDLDLRFQGRPGIRLTRIFGPEVADLTQRDPPQQRRAAALALERIHPEPAVAAGALGRLLRDPDPTFRVLAAKVLGGLVNTAQPMATKDQAELIALCCALVPVATTGLPDHSDEVRQGCVRTIAQAADLLSHLVTEPTSPAEVDDPAAYQRQVDEERTVLQPLIGVLSEQGKALARSVDDDDGRVRKLARGALENLAEARIRLIRRASSAVAVSGREETTGNRSSSFAFLLADPLVQPLREALPALGRGLEDPDERARRSVLDVLETLGHAAAPLAPNLIKATSDSDHFVRWAAVRTLGRIHPGDPTILVSPLVRALSDSDREVQLAAMGALQEYASVAQLAVPALLRGTRAADPTLRVAALRTLNQIGKKDGVALAVLEAALHDPDARVRRAAAEALTQTVPASENEDAASLLRPSGSSGEGNGGKVVGQTTLPQR